MSIKKILKFVLERAKERSTWLGIISFVTALGLVLSPEQKEAVITTGMAVAGLVATFTKDRG